MTIYMTTSMQGDVIESGPVTFRIAEDGRAVAGRFGVVECTLAPGWPGTPQHIHREHDETFYVVTGLIGFTSGSEQHVARPGSLVTVPIGSPHTFSNLDSDAPATVLCTVTPERYLGYFRDLADLKPGRDGLLVPTEVLQVMARYGTEPYHPS